MVNKHRSSELLYATVIFSSIMIMTSCSLQLPHMKSKNSPSHVPDAPEDKAIATGPSVSPTELKKNLFENPSEPQTIAESIDVELDDEHKSSNPAVTNLSRLAVDAVNSQDWEKAKSALERALKITPSDASIWRRLAYCYHQTEHYHQALAQAQRAASLSSQSQHDQILNQVLIRLISSEIKTN
jgi:tetratricopeptide (TPR) repeat protein